MYNTNCKEGWCEQSKCKINLDIQILDILMTNYGFLKESLKKTKKEVDILEEKSGRDTEIEYNK